MHSAFEALMNSGDTDVFEAACRLVGEAFQAASACINAAEEALRSAGRADCADVVRRLQLQEKEHLRMARTRRLRAPSQPGAKRGGCSSGSS